MPNLNAARKRVRTSLRNAIRNSKAIRKMREMIHAADSAIVAKDNTVKDQVLAAISLIDKLSERGIIHRNNAARRKSRLSLRAKLALAAAR